MNFHFLSNPAIPIIYMTTIVLSTKSGSHTIVRLVQMENHDLSFNNDNEVNEQIISLGISSTLEITKYDQNNFQELFQKLYKLPHEQITSISESRKLLEILNGSSKGILDNHELMKEDEYFKALFFFLNIIRYNIGRNYKKQVVLELIKEIIECCSYDTLIAIIDLLFILVEFKNEDDVFNVMMLLTPGFLKRIKSMKNDIANSSPCFMNFFLNFLKLLYGIQQSPKFKHILDITIPVLNDLLGKQKNEGDDLNNCLNNYVVKIKIIRVLLKARINIDNYSEKLITSIFNENCNYPILIHETTIILKLIIKRLAINSKAKFQKLIPEFLNISNCSKEAIIFVLDFILFFTENCNQLDNVSNSYLTLLFTKLLHFYKNDNYYNFLLKFEKIIYDTTDFCKIFFVLNAIDNEVLRITNKISILSKNENNLTEYLKSLSKLDDIEKEFFRISKILCNFIQIYNKLLLKCENKMIYNNIVEHEIIVNVLIHSLCFITISREIIQDKRKINFDLDIDLDLEKYSQNYSLYEEVNQINAKIQKTYFGIFPNIITCFEQILYSQTYKIWRLYFDELISPKNAIFNAKSFLTLYNSQTMLVPFLEAFFDFEVDNLDYFETNNNVFLINTFIKKSQKYLDEINFTSQNLEIITNGAFTFIFKCKRRLNSRKNMNFILDALFTTCQFIDFLSKNNDHSFFLLIFNEKLMQEICHLIYLPDCSYHLIADFIDNCIKISNNFLKYSFILETILQLVNKETTIALKLLVIAEKINSKMLYSLDSIQDFYQTALYLLESTSADNKKLLIHFINRIQKESSIDYPKVPTSIINEQEFVFKNDNSEFHCGYTSFIASIKKSLKESPNNEVLYQLIYSAIISVFKTRILDYDNRKIISSLINELLKNYEKSILAEKFIEKLLHEFNSNISLIAHLIICLCSHFLSPPKNLVYNILSLIKDKDIFREIIDEIRLISYLKLIPSKHISKCIVSLFLNELSQDIIEPISLGLFIPSCINLSLNDAKENISYDDSLTFSELNNFGSSKLKIIIETRELIKNSTSKLSPILELSESNPSNYYFSLILFELISKRTYNDEILEFFESLIINDNISFKLDILSLLLRAFPPLGTIKQMKINKILKEQFEASNNFNINQLSMLNRFIIAVVQCDIIFDFDYALFLPIIKKLYQCGSKFKQNQAKIALNYLSKKGMKNIDTEIEKFYFELCSSLNFPGAIQNMSIIDFTKFDSLILSYITIKPTQIINALLSSLVKVKEIILLSYKQHNGYSIKTENNILSLFKILSDRTVIHAFLDNNFMTEVLKSVLYLYKYNSFFILKKCEKYIVRIISEVQNVFIPFLSVLIDDNDLILGLISLCSNTEFLSILMKSQQNINIDLSLPPAPKSRYFYKLCFASYFKNTNFEDVKKGLLALIECINENFYEFSQYALKLAISNMYIHDHMVFIQFILESFKFRKFSFIKYAENVFIVNKDKYSLHDFTQLKYIGTSDDTIDFFTQFLPYVINNKQKEEYEMFISFAKNNFSIYVFINVLLILIKYDILIIEDAFTLFNMANDDKTRIKVLLYWCKTSLHQLHFQEMIVNLIPYITIYLSFEIKECLKYLIIPENEILPNEFISLIPKFIKKSDVLYSLFDVLYKNKQHINIFCWNELIYLILSFEENTNSQQNLIQASKLIKNTYKLLPNSKEEFLEIHYLFASHLEKCIKECILNIEKTNMNNPAKYFDIYFKASSYILDIIGLESSLSNFILDLFICNYEKKAKESLLVQTCLKYILSFIRTCSNDFIIYYKLIDILLELTKEDFTISLQALYLLLKNNKTFFDFEQIQNQKILLKLFPVFWKLDLPFTNQFLFNLLNGSKKYSSILEIQNYKILLADLLCFPKGDSSKFILDYFNICLNNILDSNNHFFINNFLSVILKVKDNIPQSIKKRVLLLFENQQVANLIDYKLIDEQFLQEISKKSLLNISHSIFLKFPDYLSNIFINNENDNFINGINTISSIMNMNPADCLNFIYYLDKYDAYNKENNNHTSAFKTKFYTDINKYDDLSKWNYDNNINIDDICYAFYDIIPEQNLYQYVGFNDKAINVISTNINQIDKNSVISLLQSKTPIIDQLLNIFNQYKTVQKKLYKSIINFMKEILPNINQSNYIQYIIIKQFKSAVKHLIIKNDKNIEIFKYKMNPLFPVELHKGYMTIQKTFIDYLNNSGRNDFIYKNEIHEFNYEKSIHYYNDKSESELNSQENNYQNLLAAIFVGELDTEAKSTIFSCFKSMLKINPKNNIFLSTLLSQIHLISDKLSLLQELAEIPFHFSYLFSKVLLENQDLIRCLFTKIHPSFLIFFQNNNLIPSKVRNELNLFLNPITKYVNENKNYIIKVSKSQKQIIDEFRSSEKLENSNIDKIEEIKFDKSKYIFSDFSVPVPVPLIKDKENIYKLIVFHDNFNEPYIKLIIYHKNGKQTKYIISTIHNINPRFSLFCNLINDLLKQTPESSNKSQLIKTINSFQIDNNFYLLSTEGAEPFIKKNILTKLIKIKDQIITNQNESDHRYIEVKPKDSSNKKINFLFKNDYYKWTCNFGYRYSAISMLQILLNSQIPNPLDLYIDYQNATVIFSQFEESQKDEFISIRFCGKLQRFSQKPFINGPFRTGLITSASAFSFNKHIINLYLKLFLDKNTNEKQQFNERCKSFSIRENSTDSVQNNINDLISKSLNSNPLFAIPWI